MWYEVGFTIKPSNKNGANPDGAMFLSLCKQLDRPGIAIRDAANDLQFQRHPSTSRQKPCSEMVQEVSEPSLQIHASTMSNSSGETWSTTAINPFCQHIHSKALRVGSIIPHFLRQTSARTPHDPGPCEGWILAGSTCRYGSHHALSPAIHQSTPDHWDKFDRTVMKEQSWTVPIPSYQMYLYLHIQYATKKWKFGRDKFHSQVILSCHNKLAQIYRLNVLHHTCALYFEGSPTSDRTSGHMAKTWTTLHVTR